MGIGIVGWTNCVLCGQVGMSDYSSSFSKESTRNLRFSITENADSDGGEWATENSNNHSVSTQKRDRKKTRTTLRKVGLKMIKIMREIVIMTLAAVTYAVVLNNPAKISKSPAAFPFFSEDSHVADYYKGDLSSAKEKSRFADMSFVMFYAPWSAECKAVREEFAKVAKHFHNQIEMSAVNCWQPGSECKRLYSRVYSWPILIAYPATGKGIQYRGPKVARYIMKFLMAVLKPYVRITRSEQLVDLLANHDGVVLAAVNPLPGSRDFAVFYSTALRYLSQDPNQNLVFAIFTVAPRDEFGNVIKPNLFLHLWNDTLIYPSDRPWTPNDLIEWIGENANQITMWLIPPKSKSSALSKTIQSKPSLLLFTPRNPMSNSNDIYNLLREVAHEYNSCGSPLVTLRKKNIKLKRLENYYSHKLLLRKCAIKRENIETAPPVTFLPNWINSSSKEEINKRWCRNFEDLQFSNMLTINEEEDSKSPQKLHKLNRRETCRLLRISEKCSRSIFSDSLISNSIVNETVEDVGCETNRSLLFYALDTTETYYFAEKLGINLFDRKDKTAAVIINDQLESHYILNKPVNDITLRQFINNYSENILPRSKKSLASVKSNITFNYDNVSCDKNCVFVKELNEETFLSTILQEDKAFVVMYYSKQCSFCSGISFVFLTVSRLFSSISNLKFGRIDGDINLLPWEYTINVFPTVIYIPHKRKSESRIFPYDVPVTVPNLLAFILSNSNPEVRLQVMWLLCNQTEFVEEKNKCVASIRGECLSLINTTLKEWRKADVRQKPELIYKLQQLRSLHLLFAHSPQKTHEIKSHLKRLNSKDEL